MSSSFPSSSLVTPKSAQLAFVAGGHSVDDEKFFGVLERVGGNSGTAWKAGKHRLASQPTSGFEALRISITFV